MDFDKEGIKINEAANYLAENGVDVIRKGHYGYTDRKISNSRLVKPFADIHLIEAKQYSDLDHTHAINNIKKWKINMSKQKV